MAKYIITTNKNLGKFESIKELFLTRSHENKYSQFVALPTNLFEGHGDSSIIPACRVYLCG